MEPFIFWEFPTALLWSHTIDREKVEFIKQIQLPFINKRTFKFKIMIARNRGLKVPVINLLKIMNVYYKNQTKVVEKLKFI